MCKEFKELSEFIKSHDGYGKPRIDFQEMYSRFPYLNFIAENNFGMYENFGKAFERKNKCMRVISNSGKLACMVYYEYYDTAENLAYLTVF